MSRLASDEVALLFPIDWLGFLPAFPDDVRMEDMFGLQLFITNFKHPSWYPTA